jgi:hypothetical protein
MADYADTASLSSSRPERSAPSKRRATSPSFDAPELPPNVDSVHPQVLAAEPSLEGEASAAVLAGEPDAAVRQGTLSGFETPEPEPNLSPATDEVEAASPVASATIARRAPRAKRAVAPALAAEAVTTADDMAQEGPAVSDVPELLEPHLGAAPGGGIDAYAGTLPDRAPEAAQPQALTQRLDALHGALAEQRSMAAASARQLKWVLAAASAALLASVGFGIGQSVRLDSLANESRAEQMRLEQFILKQQSTLDDLSQRLATPPAAPVAAEAPPPATPTRAAATPAAPAPARRAAAHPAHTAHPHRTQKTAH